MLTRESDGPPFFLLGNEEKILSYVEAHLKFLFSDAVKASRRSRGKRLFDSFASKLPKLKLHWVDARNSIALALEHDDTMHLARLNRRIGQIVDRTARETGFGYSKEEVAHVCAADRMAAVAFATSRSGFVREIGLSNIDRVSTGVCFALVVTRLNDWVPEVRVAAAKAIENIVKYIDEPYGGPAHAIAAAAGLLLDDERFRRATSAEREVANSLLNHPKVKEALRFTLLNKTSDRVSPRTLRAMIQHGYGDDLLPEIAMKARCAHLRLIAAKAVLYGTYSWRQEREVRKRELVLASHRSDVLRSALTDRSANVVFAALGNIIETMDFQLLDKTTVDNLRTRKEVSLQRRIALVLREIDEGLNK